MAMIQCPECGQEISDKAKKCIHCGKIFIEETMVSTSSEEIKCNECGSVLTQDDEICPNCGCPVEKEVNGDVSMSQQAGAAGNKMKSKSKKLVIGIVIAVIVILCVSGGMGYKIYSDHREEQIYKESYNEYINNLVQVQYLMLSGGSEAESLCNLTLRVWANTIYEDKDSETDKYTRPDGYFVSDFNEALSNLYADSSTVTKVSDIASNQTSVKDLIKKMQNPPEGLEKCYDTVSDLYDSYKILSDLAKNPSGSYNEFGEKKSDAVTDFMSTYEKLDNQIPEKLEIN